MTGTERKWFEEMYRLFGAAGQKVKEGSEKYILYNGIAMVLGAVLGKDVLIQNLQVIVDDIKSFGVSPGPFEAD